MHTQHNFDRTKGMDRSLIQEKIKMRELFARRINEFLLEDKLLCFPTTPTVAPKLTLRDKNKNEVNEFAAQFPKLISLNAISGLSRTPQISIPLANINNIPIGLSILAGYGKDSLLASIANEMGRNLTPHLR